MTPGRDDIAALRDDGDLAGYLLSLTVTPPAKPQPQEPGDDETSDYHIPRKGAWPCSTAPSGPTPPPCDDCAQKGTA